MSKSDSAGLLQQFANDFLESNKLLPTLECVCRVGLKWLNSSCVIVVGDKNRAMDYKSTATVAVKCTVEKLIHTAKLK